MEGKPENIIESKKYVEPHTFESDGEAVLFYSYIEAHEYIETLHSELEKARELLVEVTEKWISAEHYYGSETDSKIIAFLSEGKK